MVRRPICICATAIHRAVPYPEPDRPDERSRTRKDPNHRCGVRRPLDRTPAGNPLERRRLFRIHGRPAGVFPGGGGCGSAPADRRIAATVWRGRGPAAGQRAERRLHLHRGHGHPRRGSHPVGAPPRCRARNGAAGSPRGGRPTESAPDARRRGHRRHRDRRRFHSDQLPCNRRRRRDQRLDHGQAAVHRAPGGSRSLDGRGGAQDRGGRPAGGSPRGFGTDQGRGMGARGGEPGVRHAQQTGLHRDRGHHQRQGPPAADSRAGAEPAGRGCALHHRRFHSNRRGHQPRQLWWTPPEPGR